MLPGFMMVGNNGHSIPGPDGGAVDRDLAPEPAGGGGDVLRRKGDGPLQNPACSLVFGSGQCSAQEAPRAQRHQFRVAAVVPESGDVVSVHITGRDLDSLRARSGQFFLWRFPGHHRWWQVNPFSLSAAPNGRSLRLTAKGVGKTSAGLRNLRVGNRGGRGRLGQFFRHLGFDGFGRRSLLRAGGQRQGKDARHKHSRRGGAHCQASGVQAS